MLKIEPPMKKRASRTVWVIALLVLASVAVWRLFAKSDSPAATEDPGLIDDRVWLETNPEKPTQYVHVAYFIEEADLGIFQRGSSYDMRLELFEFSRNKNAIELTFPQSGRTAKFTFEVKGCSDKRPFDLCLDVSANPWSGPRRYYGFMRKEDEAKETKGLSSSVRAQVRSARSQ